MQERVRVSRLLGPEDLRTRMRDDVRAGLAQRPRSIPPKYFYDERGSTLFEEITRLPEYYPTRTETALLESVAPEVARAVRPVELVELGSGASRKTRLLLESMREHGGRRYVPFDVSEEALRDASARLVSDYDWLEVDGLVGDFDHHLDRIPRTGRAVVAFLGSTIGNLHPVQRAPFLARVAATFREGDRLLLGTDLVKDAAVLEAAYDDAAGVTAEFNRNVLRVLNRELDGDFPVDDFAHRAFYDAENAWIEMRLVARRAVRARLADLDLEVDFAEGEELHTELSCKFTRASVEEALRGAGLELERWFPSPDGAFALSLARPATA